MPTTDRRDRPDRRQVRRRDDRRPARRRDERGEGVISAAIAVLVMAAIGALMWVGFREIWEDTESNTRERVDEIGR
jgi:hypothetical protein